MDTTHIRQMTGQVSQLLADRLGARGPTLHAQVDAARRLPRRVRKAAAVLAEAEMLSASPRMARRLDMARIGRAHAACLKYLRPIGAGERARRFALDIMVSVAFGLAVIAAAAIAVAHWRGLL